MKVSLFTAIDLMTAKLLLVCISSPTKLTFELENWFLYGCSVAPWQDSDVVLSAAVGNMFGILGPGLQLQVAVRTHWSVLSNVDLISVFRFEFFATNGTIFDSFLESRIDAHIELRP